MNTLNSLEIRLIDHMVCEVRTIKKGEIACANQMLIERMEAMNRLNAMQCLIAEDDSEYTELIEYIFQQTKEMVTKLQITN